MTRKLALLNGLAILAVILNHAARWGLISMFGLVEEASPAIAPGPGQTSGLGYLSLVAIQQLCYFSVLAFLFISGYFMAYAANAGDGRISWKVVRSRIVKLLWPYLIWSVIVFALDAVRGQVYTPGEYLFNLVTGKTLGPYYYVPMLCQFYLLSPFICSLGKQRPKLLLAIAGAIQVIGLGYIYYKFTGLNPLGSALDYSAIAIWYAFFFPLGVVVGFHLKTFQTWLARWRQWFLVLAIGWGAASIVESEWLYRVLNNFEDGHGMLKVTTGLYALCLILTLIAYDFNATRVTRLLNRLGTKSYGIYLLSPALLYFAARFLGRFIPQLEAQPLILVVVLAATAIGGTLLVMEFVARSPARSAYRYLFG